MLQLKPEGLHLDDAMSLPVAVWMLGQEGLYPVATRFLVGD